MGGRIYVLLFHVDHVFLFFFLTKHLLSAYNFGVNTADLNQNTVLADKI